MSAAPPACYPPHDTNTWRVDPIAAACAWLRDTLYKGDPYSEATIRKLLSIVRRYLASLQARGSSLEQAGAADIAHFLNALEHLQRDGTLALTRHRYLRTLESLHGELERIGLRSDNPARALLRQFPPPRARPLPEALTATEESRLVAALCAWDSHTNATWRTLRDAAMVAVAIGSGLQPREIVALGIDDVSLSESPPFVTVASHGRRPERVAPISPSVRPILAAWLDTRTGMAGDHAAALFCGSTCGESLTVRSVHRACKTWITAAGIQRTHKGGRVLRGAFATRQLRAGKPTTVLRDWMGLAQENSAAAYARGIVNPDGVEVA